MRGIEFLNKIMGILGNFFVDFSKKPSFCDIPKWIEWNRGEIIWDRRSNILTYIQNFDFHEMKN